MQGTRFDYLRLMRDFLFTFLSSLEGRGFAVSSPAVDKFSLFIPLFFSRPCVKPPPSSPLPFSLQEVKRGDQLFLAAIGRLSSWSALHALALFLLPPGAERNSLPG